MRRRSCSPRGENLVLLDEEDSLLTEEELTSHNFKLKYNKEELEKQEVNVGKYKLLLGL